MMKLRVWENMTVAPSFADRVGYQILVWLQSLVLFTVQLSLETRGRSFCVGEPESVNQVVS